MGVNKLFCLKCARQQKTSYCLDVTCELSLFNAGVEEKLIWERTGHCFESLFKYERPSKEKIAEVSSVLGPSTITTQLKMLEEKKRVKCDKFGYH